MTGALSKIELGQGGQLAHLEIFTIALQRVGVRLEKFNPVVGIAEELALQALQALIMFLDFDALVRLEHPSEGLRSGVLFILLVDSG